MWVDTSSSVNQLLMWLAAHRFAVTFSVETVLGEPEVPCCGYCDLTSLIWRCMSSISYSRQICWWVSGRSLFMPVETGRLTHHLPICRSTKAADGSKFAGWPLEIRMFFLFIYLFFIDLTYSTAHGYHSACFYWSADKACVVSCLLSSVKLADMRQPTCFYWCEKASTAQSPANLPAYRIFYSKPANE